MQCCCCFVIKSCLTLCNSVDCSLPGSSVHGIPQARILEWVAISSSRGSSWPRDWTFVSCIGRWILYHWATRKAHRNAILKIYNRMLSPFSVLSKLISSISIYLRTFLWWRLLFWMRLLSPSWYWPSFLDHCCCLVIKSCLTLLQPHGL